MIKDMSGSLSILLLALPENACRAIRRSIQDPEIMPPTAWDGGRNTPHGGIAGTPSRYEVTPLMQERPGKRGREVYDPTS
jgi:hypothetical protein